jgi:hypothetical protein
MAKLDALQQHLGHGYRGNVIEYLIIDAYNRILGATRWEQQQAHAHRVLKRLKPGLLVSAEEITGVSFMDGGDRVCIQVALNSQPYQVSRREWDK